jgi:CRP-like cAMP-binding protein
LKVFLEMSLNEISFFKKLPKHIKNEFLFCMKPKTYEKGSCLYKRDDNSTEMYCIQSGMIEIFHYLDKKEQYEFVIERLYRGSIINHNSFLMNDELDTDARCATNVTVYYLDINTFKNLRSKHIALDQIMDTHEAWLVGGNRKEPAIDYII